MQTWVKTARRLLNTAGVEMVRYPAAEWVASRYILTNVLNKLAINVVLDVGANHGQYGSHLRDLGYNGHIVSFEPIRNNFAALQECAANSDHWKCFNYALGAEKGEAQINVTEEDVFSSFLQPTQDSLARFPTNKVVKVETVKVRRLDSVFQECLQGVESPRVYLKIDTQGFDLQVLAGASGMLDQIAGLQTEVSFRRIYEGSPSYTESIEAFRSHGFGVCDFMPVTRGSDGLSSIEMDCIMVRQDRSDN